MITQMFDVTKTQHSKMHKIMSL